MLFRDSCQRRARMGAVCPGAQRGGLLETKHASARNPFIVSELEARWMG